jgi:hypothetical protein
VSSSPDVLDGMRAPRSVRLEDIHARAAAGNGPAVPVDVDGVTTYVSRYKRYRVQITAPTSGINPITGQPFTTGRELVAQFEEHVFRNTERDPEARALIDRTLQSNPYFGKFNTMAHFWLSNEQRAATEAAKLKSALDTLKSLPKEALEQHLGQLGLGVNAVLDHKLPDPPAASSPAAPTPSPADEIAQAVDTAVKSAGRKK